MRTDTATFRSRVYKQVRALSINAVRSERVAKQIVRGISRGLYADFDQNGYEARKTINSLALQLRIRIDGAQYVDVLVDGELAFSTSTGDLILVSLEATAEQLEIRKDLEVLYRNINAVISQACIRWENANGYPASNAEADLRHDAVNVDPAVIAAQAEYDALRDRSLAINPHAPLYTVDPQLSCSYSDNYKHVTGCRPRTYTSYADAKAFFADLDNRHIANLAA